MALQSHLFKSIFALGTVSLLSACGAEVTFSDDDNDNQPTPLPRLSIEQASFQDTNAGLAQLSGTITYQLDDQSDLDNTDYFVVYWADQAGDVIDSEALASVMPNDGYIVVNDWLIPADASQFAIVASNDSGQSEQAFLLEFRDLTGVPSDEVTTSYFRDFDGAMGEIGGQLTLNPQSFAADSATPIEQVLVSWADEQGSAIGEPWLIADLDETAQITVPAGTVILNEAVALHLAFANSIGQSEQEKLVFFNDFTGKADLSGPGGNEMNSWYYGDSRPTIAVQRTLDGTCIFDNGLVAVTDMNNQTDELWDGEGANQVNEDAFPAYQYACDESPVNTYRAIEDDVGVWTYSTINDAMFYGTVTYDAFLKYLGEPALNDKLRLRVHYDRDWKTIVYWDGAYANFSDSYPFQYSTATLDIIAHEIAHGVLIRISALDAFEAELSEDAKTVHEAFADISGVMVKSYFQQDDDIWVHGAESNGWVRELNQIQTEPNAIASYLDYDDADGNYYLRIGMITYPFYQLANQWGLEAAYQVILSAAKGCWQPDLTLPDAALCIQHQAGVMGYDEQAVVDAFKSVKIQLFEAGVLSHFDANITNNSVALTDDSRSTSQVTQWLWDFGDGNTATEANPVHTYNDVGQYTVTLTVTDESQDTDSFSRQITIE